MIEIFNVSIFVTGAIKGHRGSKSEHVSCTQTIKQLLLCTLCGPHCSPFLPTLMDYGMSKQTAFYIIDKLCMENDVHASVLKGSTVYKI